jgi:signal peptidase I
MPRIKSKIFFLFIINILVLVFTELFWLTCLTIILSGALYYIFILKPQKSKIVNYCLTTASVLFISIFIKIFVIDIYNIPSESMEDTLFKDDIIIISKLDYGPKLPEELSDVPWISLVTFFKYKRSDKAKTWWNYRRLKGNSSIKRGDLIVFKNRMHAKETLIKRCIGLPGESIKIVNGTVFIDDNLLSPYGSIKNPYRIWFNNPKKLIEGLKNLNNNSYMDRQNYTQAYLKGFFNQNEISKIAKLKCVDSVKIDVLTSTENVYPGDSSYKWTCDNFGSLLIPRKGMTIKLTPANFILYGKLIKDFEGIYIKRFHNDFYLQSKQIRHYTFKQDYFFMLGDNRHNSADSRFWGMVPEKTVEGKAFMKILPKLKYI